ncbi:type II toxin-antitoxin system VapB family antitoxin [Sinorhizobium sp. 8-89]|uniref:type II toxin-antitoxin system VapB family antitoxin n=1 Tax=Sinorhizobium sp. 8-89 TaxID=3049089 RepID=UPI00286807A6|nr:type II toxin-antitoxin system VapB family antitoxin [Sinorhizobium sp. 8-89]
MSEPQLSIRSAKAKELAHALARRTGMPMNKLVEQALEHYDSELRQQKNHHPIDAVWDLAAAGNSAVPADASSAHDDLYDEHGLPK